MPNERKTKVAETPDEDPREGFKTTRHDLRVHRHADGYIEVQIDGKTSGCPGGAIECAFKRAWDWKEHHETHGPEVCFKHD